MNLAEDIGETTNVAGDHPDLLYVILGATHPEVRKTEGEKYRLVLQRRVEELGLTDHVVFVNRFVELEELCEYLLAADAFVTPYPSREQISSGTLTYALALGKELKLRMAFLPEPLYDDAAVDKFAAALTALLLGFIE